MILMTVQGVSKSFGMKSVLKDISLTLQQGARMGLIGVNGSGKSTLFRLIAGQMEPDEGTISLMRGTRVGMLTQEADIQRDLTVREELSRVFEPVREMERRLRALEEENVVLSFNGPVSPFILQNQGVKESLYLILPVRNAA